MIKVGDPILAEVRGERGKTILCCLFRNQLKEGGNDGIFLSVDGLGMKEKREPYQLLHVLLQRLGEVHVMIHREDDATNAIDGLLML